MPYTPPTNYENTHTGNDMSYRTDCLNEITALGYDASALSAVEQDAMLEAYETAELAYEWNAVDQTNVCADGADWGSREAACRAYLEGTYCTFNR